MADHDPTPAHAHQPVLRLVVTWCPDDADDALIVDVDIGPPLDGWTGAEVAAGIVGALDHRLAASLDATWRRHRAARN